MKIAIYDPYLDTMSGGEKYMISIAICLSKNHDVSIIWDKTPPERIAQLAKTRFDFDLTHITFAKSPFSSHTSLIDRYKMTRGYDMIILLSDGSIPITGCPLVLHFQSPMPWIKQGKMVNRLKLTRVKKIIVNSRFTKSFIDQNFGKKSEVLYPPVTIQRTYDPSKKTNIILNVGRFGVNQAGSSFKKQDILADAFVRMVDDGLKDWKMVFVMSFLNKDREMFENFKKNYSNYPIEILSNITNVKLWDLYEKASIYWHASGFGEDLESYPDRAEHFGISTAEAMGVGAVPIVVNAGGQKEIVENGHNGYLWSDIGELIKKTKDLTADSNRLQKLAVQGAKDAEKFSDERFCSNVNKLIL